MGSAADQTGARLAASETGWLPDCVYTGEKFESGLAFFADAVGRITRFSREPADLAAARRLSGQAALPGLVNGHSQAFQRMLRGRAEHRPAAAREGPWSRDEAVRHLAGRLSPESIYDSARMAFMEMLLGGITCVGEFHFIHHQPDGSPWPDPNFLSLEVIRAARSAGIRIALLKVACARGGFPAEKPAAQPRALTPSVDRFIAEADALRVAAEGIRPGDEAWVGLGVLGLGSTPVDYLKAAAGYGHSQRMRLHVPVSAHAAENEACMAEYGRTPVALLAKHGLIDKRFTAVHAIHITEEETQALGTARASVCTCPASGRNLGMGPPPAAKLLAAGAGISLGTDSQVQIDLFEDARLLEPSLRAGRPGRAAFAPDLAPQLFHAATVTGARSLGGPGGALEVGRPADFFTVNLFDPSLAGAGPHGLLGNIMFSPGRRGVRDVWVGARQRVTNGRHADQGGIVGRFVELQERLWANP